MSTPFIHDDFLLHNFLLHNEPARRLYHEVAASLPTIDYHSHLLANQPNSSPAR